MDQRLVRLLRRQAASGFEDLRGAEAAVTLPVSDRLLNEIITETLPASTKVKDVQVRAAGGQPVRGAREDRGRTVSACRSTSRSRSIDSLSCRHRRSSCSGSRWGACCRSPVRRSGSSTRFRRASGSRTIGCYIDLAQLLAARGLSGFLDHLEQLNVQHRRGTTILSLRARIRRGIRPAARGHARSGTGPRPPIDASRRAGRGAAP